MPDRVKQIRFRSMAHQAAGQLRRGVVEGRFRPGERLLEQKLAAAFGVSQATVREALNVL